MTIDGARFATTGAPSGSEIQTPGDIALACNGDLAFTSALDDRIRVGVNDGGPAPGNICD